MQDLVTYNAPFRRFRLSTKLLPAAVWSASAGGGFVPYLTAGGEVERESEVVSIHRDGDGAGVPWEMLALVDYSTHPNYTATLPSTGIYQDFIDPSYPFSYRSLFASVRALSHAPKRVFLSLSALNENRDAPAPDYKAVTPAAPPDYATPAQDVKIQDYVDYCRWVYDGVVAAGFEIDYFCYAVEWNMAVGTAMMTTGEQVGGFLKLLADVYAEFAAERAAGLLMGPSIQVRDWMDKYDGGPFWQAVTGAWSSVANCYMLSSHPGAFAGWESYVGPIDVNRYVNLRNYGLGDMFTGAPIIFAETSSWDAVYGGATVRDHDAHFAAIENLAGAANVVLVDWWTMEDCTPGLGSDPRSTAPSAGFALRGLKGDSPAFAPRAGYLKWREWLATPLRIGA